MSLNGLQRLTRSQFRVLSTRFPELGPRGATLFLGKHYASQTPQGKRIVMLGINPGLSEDCPVHVRLSPVNRLLPHRRVPGHPRPRYWHNASLCFAAHPSLLTQMDYATYALCSPFRTPSWATTPAALRSALVDFSRPILQQLLADCQPTVVIVAGKVAIHLLETIGAVTLLQPLTVEGGAGNFTWARGQGSEARTGRRFRVIQVPHFSRFSSRQGLHTCGQWLATVV